MDDEYTYTNYVELKPFTYKGWKCTGRVYTDKYMCICEKYGELTRKYTIREKLNARELKAEVRKRIRESTANGE